MESTEDTQEKQAIEENGHEQNNKKLNPPQGSLCTDQKRSKDTREVDV